MEVLISCCTIWIAPVLIAWVALKSKWLNLHPQAVGRFAECTAWLGFGTSTVATLLWALGDTTSVVTTLTDAGWFGIRFDALSATIFLLVCFLGAIILRFSRNYLAGDEAQGYFFKWMCITLGSVMALVLSPGLIQFFVAWMATSLGLHKLLVYYADRKGTLLSARKKFVASRVADFCLLLAFVAVFVIYGVQDFGQLFMVTQEHGASLDHYPWIGWLIVLGAMLKSALFPFHTWLPDTLGAPTPVSALMHAGIINGGGYLVVRMSPVLVNTPGALHLLAIFGALTAVYGSVVMLSQTSVKRALAYSTIAQMGFMLLQCGLGAFQIAVLHIVAHSLYKGHAFLSSGSAVATAKKLNANPRYVKLPQTRIWFAVGVAFGIVAGLSYVFGVNPSNKPGMSVLGVVLVMAITQLLWTQMRRGRTSSEISKTAILAAGVVAIYFALTMLSTSMLKTSLPAEVPSWPVTEYLLTFFIFASLLTTIRFQDGHPGFLSVAYKRRLYVHALNGFYFNTIANRIARKLGLVSDNQ